MEKGIVVVARYRYDKQYVVEVSQEDSATAERDYWLCNDRVKQFMFSKRFQSDETEERLICQHIGEAIRKFNRVQAVSA